MKDQLIIILEAMRLSRAALARQGLSDGPSTESTIHEIRALLESQNVDLAMEILYPEVEAPGIAPTDGMGLVRRH
jgi:hypothetical protein